MRKTPSNLPATTDNQNASKTADLVKKAGQGDHDACAQFYAMMDKEGKSEGFVRSITSTTEDVLKRRHNNLIAQEAFRRTMKRMRKDLGIENAPPLERLLIERIVIAWHHLHNLESSYQVGVTNGMSMEKCNDYEKSLDKAQKRYLAAIHSLALVRRLALPAIQLNFARQQANFAGNAPVPPMLEPIMSDQ